MALSNLTLDNDVNHRSFMYMSGMPPTWLSTNSLEANKIVTSGQYHLLFMEPNASGLAPK